MTPPDPPPAAKAVPLAPPPQTAFPADWGGGWVGPLFYWDLVRLARRGQAGRSRMLLGLVLLVALLVFPLAWFGWGKGWEFLLGGGADLPIREVATFAGRFSLAILLAQMAGVTLLAPAYGAGGIGEEKDRRTLGFLLASHLSDREIVTGKLLGRAVFMLAVMAVGFPFLGITLLFGGTDPWVLLASYLVTGATAVMLVALSTAAACFSTGFRGALFRAYGLTALIYAAGTTFSPPGFLILLSTRLAEGGPWVVLTVSAFYAGGELLVATAAYVLAVRNLRWRDPPPVGPPVPAAAIPVAPQAAAVPAAVPRAVPVAAAGLPPGFTDRPPPRPPVGADPFVWKERYVTGLRATADESLIREIGLLGKVLVVLLVVPLACSGVCGGMFATPGSIGTGGVLLTVAGSALVFGQWVAAGSFAAAAVSRERERRTLESLLAIPADRAEMLAAKRAESLRRGWRWGAPGVALVLLGQTMSNGPLAGVLAPLALALATLMLGNLGLWLSVVTPAATRAVVRLVAAGGVVLAAPYLLAAGLGGRDAPAAAWLAVGLACAAGTGVFVVLGNRAFEREGRE